MLTTCSCFQYKAEEAGREQRNAVKVIHEIRAVEKAISSECQGSIKQFIFKDIPSFLGCLQKSPVSEMTVFISLHH